MSACKRETRTPDRADLKSIEITPEVVFSVVDDEPLTFFIESRGVVEATQSFPINLRIGGFIEEHAIVDGNQVQKGQILIHLNEQEWLLRVQETYNALIKARSDYEIYTSLREESGAIPRDSLIRVNTGLADAEVSHKRAKLDLSFAKIVAPFSGEISTEQFLTDGAFVNTGTELGTLINTQSLRVRFDVLEAEISSIGIGSETTVIAPSGEELTGKVVAISPQIDTETKTGKILVEIKNLDGILKPGMTVEGRIFVREERSKVRMPRAALLERDGRTLIFKLHSEIDEVEWIYVQPIAMNTRFVLIDHPEINPGDTLAIDQHFSISHQQKVKPLIVN
ncbi:MAG: efflux RND transporter periplasmic adaptor subunit [Bacteroidota bacterium]